MADKTETVNALDKAAAHIIQKATDGMDAAVSFLSDQIPDVVRQLLIWEMSWSIFVTIMFIASAFVCLYLQKKAVAYGKAENDEAAIVVGTIFPYIGTGLSILCAVFSAKTALMIAIAPKVYLIRYAADLLK